MAEFYFNRRNGNPYLDLSSVREDSKERHLILSLFSGAGGLDIGLENAGFQTVGCIENDEDCRETLKFNRPEWHIFDKDWFIDENGLKKSREAGDIKSITSNEVMDELGVNKGEISLIVGGAPCQPFSNIGKKEGVNDEENGSLFLEFLRFVRDFRPKGFIFENVAGITQKKHKSVLEYMYQTFKDEGYEISYEILNSANYGVPQRRERFFLIGLEGNVKPAFPLPTHYKDKESWKRFANNIYPLPNFSPKPWKTVGDAFSKIPYNKADNRKDFLQMKISKEVVERMKHIQQGENFKVLPNEIRPNCWKNGKHQGNDTFGRLQDDLPSVTIRTSSYNPSKGRYIHPYENRGLNTFEMATLQDFPYDWEFKVAPGKRMSLKSIGMQIGNAVPPRLGKAIALSLKEQIEMYNRTIDLKKSRKPNKLLPDY
ncbi:MAG: DNA cytosine methyltransferase [Flavobacteriales bacterium]